MADYLLGNKIKELRLDMGLTLKDFAEKIGSSASYVSEVERGVKNPGSEFLLALKRSFLISIDSLLDNSVPLVREEHDPYIANVATMMRTMDDDTKKDIQLSVEKEKLLRELLKEKQGKKAG